jgi:hypothetical protein
MFDQLKHMEQWRENCADTNHTIHMLSVLLADWNFNTGAEGIPIFYSLNKIA